MEKKEKTTAKKGIGYYLVIPAVLLGAAGLMAYIKSGVTEFTPSLSKEVIAAYAVGIGLCLFSLACEWKTVKFCGYLAFLYAFLQSICVQATYVANVIVSIDGNSFSAGFLMMAVCSLFAVIAAAASACLQKKIPADTSGKKETRMCAVCLSFLVILYTGYQVAVSYAPGLNSVLGTTLGGKEKDAAEGTQYFASDYDTEEALAEYLKQVGIEVEGEGMVLLKNENQALPLSKEEKISCFLTGSVRFNYSSSGSSAAQTAGYPTLREALNESGLEVNPTLWDFYTEGDGKNYGRTTMGNTYLINEAGWEVYPEEVIASVSEYGTAVVTIARDSGEGKDISTVKSDGEDGSYLSISPQEEEVLKELSARKESGEISKIIVLLNSSAPIELDFLYRDSISVDACIWVGNVGSDGIYAIGQALVGEIVPSGKLSDTYVRDNFSSPAMASWMQNAYSSFSQKYTNAAEYGLNSTQENYAAYVEGIYVGYRYYETRYEDYVMGADGTGDYKYEETVAYPFGHGESYTEFAYSDFAVTENEEENSFEIQVTVTNTGEYDGKEVVEIYLQKPYTEYDKENGIEKASAELVGFAKTDVLKADGGSETVTISVEKEKLKSYDSNGYQTYILEEGSYYLTAAENAHAAVNQVLAAKGFSPENTDGRMDAEGMADLVYEWKNDTLDTETYSVSSQTGEKITNQFDNADINRYEGSGENEVTYVSRKDWSGTWPMEAVTLSIATEKMAEDIASNKPLLEDDSKIPQYGADNGLTLVSLRSTEENPIPYDDERWELLLDQMTFEEQSALLTTAQMSTIAVASVGKPATTEADGPTGVSSTTTSTSFPSEGIWASTYNTELIEKVGDAIAEDALAAGVTGMYAGGVNIHRTPFDGRSHEYFSEDPHLTGMASMYEVRGMQKKGVIAHVKHLAFNEEETNRNGVGIWLNEQEAREIMLVPFEYSLSPELGNAHAVMTSFNRAGTNWTGAHTGLLQNVIHDEWGFEGYNITDMASSNGAYYMTYQDGIMLGTDCFLGAGSADALNSFKNNAAFCQRMREASHRILYNVANYSAAINGLSAEDTVSAGMPWWQTVLLSILTAAAAASAVSVVLYGISWKKQRIKQ